MYKIYRCQLTLAKKKRMMGCDQDKIISWLSVCPKQKDMTFQPMRLTSRPSSLNSTSKYPWWNSKLKLRLYSTACMHLFPLPNHNISLIVNNVRVNLNFQNKDKYVFKLSVIKALQTLGMISQDEHTHFTHWSFNGHSLPCSLAPLSILVESIVVTPLLF